MGDYTDSYGTWVDLGTLPAIDGWQQFTRSCQNAIMFRFIFTANWTDWQQKNGYRSWAWARFVHSDDSGGWNDKRVQPSFKIWPKQEQMIREFKYLAVIYGNSFVDRRLEFHRIVSPYPKPRRTPPTPPNPDGSFSSPVIPWSLQVYYIPD